MYVSVQNVHDLQSSRPYNVYAFRTYNVQSDLYRPLRRISLLLLQKKVERVTDRNII